jgi:carboxymethylenebutenolidase
MYEKVQLTVSDDSTMQAHIFRPKEKQAPAIMVLPEAFGVDKHIRDVAERLSKEGYLAIAPEVFHRTAPPDYEGSYTNFEAAMPHFQPLTVPAMEADLQACYNWIAHDNQGDSKRVAAIGFCLGGRMSFLANSILPLKAAISFYGGRIAPDLLDRAPKQHGPILFFWGGLDKHIGLEQPRAISDALLKAGKPFRDVVISDGDHGFFNDDKKAFNKSAAAEAWALSLSFLKNNL